MLRAIAAIVLASLAVSAAWSWGTEGLGNAPLHEANYTEWPNVMPVINNPHRVYQSWVNGNEHFYFAGDMSPLNAALQDFAQIKAERLTVVLRPGPGRVSSFHNKQSIAFNWELHLLGGIARHMAKEDATGTAWDPHPCLTVYVGDAIQLDELDIPAGVAVVELADLQRQYTQCLASDDRDIRGWSCFPLAQLDPYDGESMRKIASLLDADDEWVKLNAASALAQFTGVADEAIARLRAVKTDNGQLRERVERSIELLQQAQPSAAARKEYEQTLTAIHAFVAAQRAKQQGN